MMTPFEHAALGAALLGAAAFGIARGAVYFRSTYSGADRFYATSLVSVALVALLVGGLFYLINAVFAADGLWQVPASAAALAYAALLPVAVWRWFGPGVGADRPGAAT